MELTVDSRKRRMRHAGSVSQLLKKLGLMREEVVVKVNGRLAPDTYRVKAKDTIEVIKVVFGG